MSRIHAAFPLLTLLCVAATSWGQPTPDVRTRRRSFVENVLKTLIDSQVEREEVFHEHHHRPRPGAPAPVSKKMLRVRQELATLSQSSGDLLFALQREQQYQPQLRPLLADCVQIKANSEVLLKRANTYPDLAVITTEYRQIDRDWRILRNRLKKVRKLNVGCTKQMEVVDRCSRDLCGVLEIQPQFNRQEIVALSAAYTSDIRALVHDVQSDLRVIPQGPAVLRDCRELYSMCNQTSRLAQTGNYDAVVKNYQTCQRLWRRIAKRLVSCRSERVRRHVHTIEEIGQQCQEQLWIPVEVDTEFVGDLVRTLDTDIHGLLENIRAEDLLNCDRPCQALEILRDFRDGCHELSGRMQGNPAFDSLAWDFRSLDVMWHDVNQLCRQFPVQEAQMHLDNMDHIMQLAREYLGDAPVITQTGLVQVCGELDQLAHQMGYQIRQAVTPGNFQRPFIQQINNDCASLQTAVHELHQSAISECAESHVHAAPRARRVLELWRALRVRMKTAMAGNCPVEQRLECLRIRNQLEPLMVKLQVVYDS